MATGSEQQAAAEEVVSVDMPAPEGWTKKFTPQRGGRFEIVFVSPTGEEIKNKRHLTQYLKANPGGPTSSEFDWGTGDTPRRSARISEKVKVFDSPEGEKIPKRSRNSSGRKGKQEKKEAPEEGKETEAGKEGATGEDTANDVEMKSAEEEKTAAGEDASKSTDVDIKPVEEEKSAPSEDAGKKEDSLGKADVPVEDKQKDGKPGASDPPAEDKKEDSLPAESDATPPASTEGEKKEEVVAPAASNPTENSVAAPASETKADAAPIESLADQGAAQQESQQAAATKESSPVVNNGQPSPGASAVKCT